MIVVDASVLADAVADDRASGARARDALRAAGRAVIAPDLVDVESASVFRDWYHRGYLTEQRFRDAVADLLALPFTRFPVGPLLPRTVDLRDNVTAYDACYVALAEAMDATLLTADARLVAVPGIECPVEVLRDG